MSQIPSSKVNQMKLNNYYSYLAAITYSAHSPKTPASIQKQKVESGVDVSSSSKVAKAGSSYENAIKVKNIREENDWLRKTTGRSSLS